ncbi:hypothetical protein LTR70_004937 [Exophiala xenobiotica]|uniref:Catalase n=1 Tax=Lithohypha guttulata TaxID=1690604 RepID=A0ABR0KC14_9EURO|nr:hypothetical protein LTR24_004531 [Lithohypha guttulata]KAK5319753.1 hypothetical protein LTR70_004937 [Exophiala xenobiotica]
MADWEDAALSTRHMHNRVGRQGRAKNGKSGGAFDARKTFGTYEVKCPAAAKLATSGTDGMQASKLEIYTLNDSENALVATEESVEEADAETQAGSTMSDRDDSGENEDEEHIRPFNDPVNRVVREFEKNSFRSPKFWLRWQGQLLQSSTDHPVTDFTSGTGYLIWSGNGCDKFQGTFTCQQLGWDNVKISGWKTASRSARDFAVAWHNELE